MYITKHFYQIIREIKLIIAKWNIKVKLEKIKAYQDDKKTINQFTWFEYLNTKCNKKAKALIQ